MQEYSTILSICQWQMLYENRFLRFEGIAEKTSITKKLGDVFFGLYLGVSK